MRLSYSILNFIAHLVFAFPGSYSSYLLFKSYSEFSCSSLLINKDLTSFLEGTLVKDAVVSLLRGNDSSPELIT
jgi:hypothetical protein